MLYQDWRPEGGYTTKVSHRDIDPLTLDQWKVSVIDELQCEVTTPILPLSSQPALWLNISGPWEVIF